MRVFAIELDGPLAQKEAAIMSHLFEVYEATGFDFGHITWAQRINKPAVEVAEHITKALELDSFWQDFKCNKPVAEEMSRWAFAGLVPSVVCRRPKAIRINTELWLAQNYVPYSNLLFTDLIEDVSRALGYVDAEFLITSNAFVAEDVSRFNKDINVYIMRDVYNSASLRNLSKVSKVTIVDSLTQVAEKEGIRTNG